MKCMHCGAEIPEDQMICPRCGREIQIVPDYNPLDDMLTAQIRGLVSQTMAIHVNQNNTETENDPSYSDRTGYEQRTRYVGNANGQYRSGGTAGSRQYNRMEHSRAAQSGGRISGTSSRERSAPQTGKMSDAERRSRQRRARKRKEIARRKRRRLLLMMAVAVLLIVGIGVLLYQNSYTGRVKKGYRLLNATEYDSALTVFEKAASGSKAKSEAYTGISKVYIAQKELDKAEEVFTEQIDAQPANAEIYRATVEFYLDTKQEEKVSPLLNACTSDQVLDALSEYVSEEPEFSLDETETYDDVQALELTGKGKAIYYTTDGTDPTTSSTKYTDPIKIEEGETEVRAISVNKKGIPSLVESKTYKVEFPIADAPAVTPSTGQYSSAQSISVVVPDKYEAYYTTDGSDPDPQNNSATQKYTGPITMPSGSTIFSFVLQDQKGRLSDITRRNYELN